MTYLYLLFELDEHAVRAGRMDERDQRAVGARPRMLVDQPDAVRLEPRQGRREVVDPQRDVVQARATPLEIPGNRRVLAGRFEELERRPGGGDEVRPHPLRRDLLGRFDCQAERVAI